MVCPAFLAVRFQRWRLDTDSIASWAFRFANSLPGVQVVLSGMTQLDQAADNVRTFSDPSPLSDEEKRLLDKVFSTTINLVPCTSLRVLPRELSTKPQHPPAHCPVQRNVFRSHTQHVLCHRGPLRSRKPDHCIACGECARICPQGIETPETIKALTQAIANKPVRMPPPPVQPAAASAR